MRATLAVTTRETVEFLASRLPPGGSLVEVGCGDGDVALELARRGHRVTAVDADGSAVARARERGVDALHASWPDVECEAADAVAFTRSLHHIADLDSAITRVRQLADTVLVEDFAFDGVDARTLAWFRDVLADGVARELVRPESDGLLARLLESDDPLAVWHGDHDHDLHTVAAMRAALENHFTVGDVERVPYLYRYLVPALPPTHEAATFLGGVFEDEARLEQRGAGKLIGARIAGSAPAR